MERFYIEFGTKIRKIRLDKKMTQDDVSSRMGIARTTYSAYELGTKRIPFDTSCKLADVFGMDINELVADVRKYVYK